MKSHHPLIALALAAMLAAPIVSRGDDAAASPPPATQPQGLDSFDENLLYSELANHGLDDLLKRAMETDRLPTAKQQAIWSMSSLHRLESEPDLSESQRQAMLDNVAAGIDHLLKTINDPSVLVKEAKIIADKGVDPQTGILEYWGESAPERAKLKTLADAALKMYSRADDLANNTAKSLADQIKSPDDKLADEWKKASDLAAAAEYQKARMQYALALSLDSSDPERPQLIDDATKTLQQWDNGDSGIQGQVELLICKLDSLSGDPDRLADAKKKLVEIIDNPGNIISPAPSHELVFEARCYILIVQLMTNDTHAADVTLADATRYLKKYFPNDQDQAAALRLLSYRILAAKADVAPQGAEKDAANAAAVQALSKLIQDFPYLRAAIFRQLAARLPANPDLARLDPMLLLTLVDQGREIISGPADKVDKSRLQEPLAAAQQIVERYKAGNLPANQAELPSLLVGIFQDYIGDKSAAVDSLLDHVERFKDDPNAHADIALDRARALIGELRQSSPDSAQVQQLEDRFFPIAINPPFNEKEFTLQYAGDLLRQGKWAEAAKYYHSVPDTDAPPRVLTARYGELASIQNQLEDTPGLDPQKRQAWTAQIQQLADSVRQLAGQIINSSTSDADKNRARSTLASVSLIAADIARREQNDPQRVLQLLNGFEDSVKALPDAKSLTNGALFLRVQAYMQLGKDNDAVNTLVQYLSAASPGEGAQSVRDLLAKLNKELDQARAELDAAKDRHDDAAARSAEATVHRLADNRAMLSGYLVKWADNSTDPKIRGYSYVYRRFDADTKREAAEQESDPAARRHGLNDALALYKDLQSSQNVALYQAGLDSDSNADKNYPDPLVTVGIGRIAYDQGDCRTVVDTLGRLIEDRKLGDNNDQYWEAMFKTLDCMHNLASHGDSSASDAQVQKTLKFLYLTWRDGTGGKLYHDKFEALRKKVLPNWNPGDMTPGGAS